MTKRLLVGLDLGTTNTSCNVAEWEEDNSIGPINTVSIRQLIGDPEKEDGLGEQPILPSVVYLKNDGKLYTGRHCKISAPELITTNDSIVRDIKRQMGNPTWHLKVANRQIRPRHIAALLLQTVKRSIEQTYRGSDMHRLVLTIPASFSSLMRQETLRAASIAGFDLSIVDLLDEPISALLSHLNDPDSKLQQINDDATILVFDMGGGTLDASIVRLSTNTKRIEIVATSRYYEFAGNDIDLELAAFLLNKLRETQGYNDFLEVDSQDATSGHSIARIGHGLLAVGEQIKLKLSQVLTQAPQVGGIRAKVEYFRRSGAAIPIDLMLDFANGPNPTSLIIPVHELIACVEPYMSDNEQHELNIFIPIYQALRRAGIEKPSYIYLAGGSSYFPLIQNAIGGFFTSSVEMLDPIYAVSQGAVVWAHMKESGQWQIAETLRDGIFLKRRGHSFLEVFSHPAPIPSIKQDRVFDPEMSPYFPKGGNKIRLEFFQGDSPQDPLLSLCHVEDLELERSLGDDSRLGSISAYIDTNKIFHFELFFHDNVGDFTKSLSFQPGRVLSTNRQEDLEILTGLYLNGEAI